MCVKDYLLQAYGGSQVGYVDFSQVGKLFSVYVKNESTNVFFLFNVLFSLVIYFLMVFMDHFQYFFFFFFKHDQIFRRYVHKLKGHP